MKSWDNYFISMAMLVASKSKDPSTKVGCVIVGPDNEVRSTGFNGFPRGVKEVEFGGEHKPRLINKLTATVMCTNEDCRDNIPVTQEDCDKYMFTKDYMKCSPHFREGEAKLIPERWERPAKYDWVEHAERNAVYNAARVGTALKGCIVYLNWEPHPCKDCTRAFIQSGIIEVVGPDIPFPSHGGKDWSFDISKKMMDEAPYITYRAVTGWELVTIGSSMLDTQAGAQDAS